VLSGDMGPRAAGDGAREEEARSKLNGGLSGILVKRVTERVLWCVLTFRQNQARADRSGAYAGHDCVAEYQLHSYETRSRAVL
jgi:hypothetical protein